MPAALADGAAAAAGEIGDRGGQRAAAIFPLSPDTCLAVEATVFGGGLPPF